MSVCRLGRGAGDCHPYTPIHNTAQFETTLNTKQYTTLHNTKQNCTRLNTTAQNCKITKLHNTTKHCKTPSTRYNTAQQFKTLHTTYIPSKHYNTAQHCVFQPYPEICILTRDCLAANPLFLEVDKLPSCIPCF